MYAVVVKGIMNYSVQRVERPRVDPKGVLLKVRACGLCGSDLRTLRYGHPKVSPPAIIGHEICGVVEEVGGEYRGQWKVGDRLSVGPAAYCGQCEHCNSGRHELCESLQELGQAWPGGMAEYLALPPECLQLGNVVYAPQGVDDVFASMVEPASSCVNAQEKANVGLGQHVVVFGAGPIGCLHVALAKARGATQVIAVDLVPERLERALGFGADAVVNGSEEDVAVRIGEALAEKGGVSSRGPHVVICATPAPEVPAIAIATVRKGGVVVQFGGLPRDQSTVAIDMNSVHYKGLTIVGTTAFAPRHFSLSAALIASGLLPVEKLVSHRMPLEEFSRGASLALEGNALKVVFQP